mgnify:CR=1 FL=1
MGTLAVAGLGYLAYKTATRQSFRRDVAEDLYPATSLGMVPPHARGVFPIMESDPRERGWFPLTPGTPRDATHMITKQGAPVQGDFERLRTERAKWDRDLALNDPTLRELHGWTEAGGGHRPLIRG